MPKKAKKSDVMLTQKNSQKRRAAAKAHLNELLDEALTETFPASDPIAINVELESPEHRSAAAGKRKLGEGTTAKPICQ